MDVNRISGYIPGKMVFYLMQACPWQAQPLTEYLEQACISLPKQLQMCITSLKHTCKAMHPVFTGSHSIKRQNLAVQ